MKSTVDHHREALDQALRIALSTSQAALRRQALTRAASHLIHPRLLLDSPLLTDAHPWRREALLVSDALEAVTNGMEEPGVLDALADLGPDSLFHEWKHLILALHFFYEHLDEAVAAHLDQIGPASPLQAVAQTVRGLVAGHWDKLSPGQRRLAETVAQPDPMVQQWIQDVAEGLETEDEGLFWEALTDWLEHVAPHHPEQARSAVLWVWNQLEWRDFDEAILLDLAASLWGNAEAYRLAAVGTQPWDPEGACLLWLRFLLTSVREGTGRSRMAEARKLLARFEGNAPETGSEDYEAVRATLAASWNTEVRLRGWDDLLIGVSTPQTLEPRSSDHGQLDLFA